MSCYRQFVYKKPAKVLGAQVFYFLKIESSTLCLSQSAWSSLAKRSIFRFYSTKLTYSESHSSSFKEEEEAFIKCLYWNFNRNDNDLITLRSCCCDREGTRAHLTTVRAIFYHAPVVCTVRRGVNWARRLTRLEYQLTISLQGVPKYWLPRLRQCQSHRQMRTLQWNELKRKPSPEGASEAQKFPNEASNFFTSASRNSSSSLVHEVAECDEIIFTIRHRTSSNTFYSWINLSLGSVEVCSSNQSFVSFGFNG